MSQLKRDWLFLSEKPIKLIYSYSYSESGIISLINYDLPVNESCWKIISIKAIIKYFI